MLPAPKASALSAHSPLATCSRSLRMLLRKPELPDYCCWKVSFTRSWQSRSNRRPQTAIAVQRSAPSVLCRSSGWLSSPSFFGLSPPRTIGDALETILNSLDIVFRWYPARYLSKMQMYTLQYTDRAAQHLPDAGRVVSTPWGHNTGYWNIGYWIHKPPGYWIFDSKASRILDIGFWKPDPLDIGHWAIRLYACAGYRKVSHLSLSFQNVQKLLLIDFGVSKFQI